MKFDILITGSGMIGISLALALAPLPLRIGIIDSKPLPTPHLSDNTKLDVRAMTLSQGSVDFFNTIHLWQHCASYATPIHHIHISNKGAFGIARLSASDTGKNALGYVIEAQTLQAHLIKALANHTHIVPLMPLQVHTMTAETSGWTLHLLGPEGPQSIEASLVIAADGAHSTLRQLQHMPTTSYDYTQSAIVTTLQLQRDHGNIAYERFAPEGPFAMLPLSHQRAGMVLTVPSDQAATYLAMPETDFLDYVQKHFGYRLGRFLAMGPRQSYPLAATCAEQQVQPGFVLIGNAAHTLHPVAGQGLNLGLRDVAHLTKLLRHALAEKRSIADPFLLKAYETERLRDQKTTFRFTDGLVRLFSNPLPLVRLARNCGLLVFDLLPFFKGNLVQKMG